jgi:hypothetical protein
MSDDSEFFGDVFDRPDEDPLLRDDLDREPPPESSADPAEKAPSWMSEDAESGAQAGAGRTREGRPERKTIIVDQGAADGDGLEELNEALGRGWQLVQLSLARPDGPQASSRPAARFEAVLEQDSPQSLFDFGPA